MLNNKTYPSYKNAKSKKHDQEMVTEVPKKVITIPTLLKVQK